jgi:hypothetical protein
MAGRGLRYTFHGAFGTKARAVRKEAQRRGAWIKQITFRRGPNKAGKRWLVITED